jgi:alpha-amylase/alpha-mannosidase (GH57 family)
MSRELDLVFLWHMHQPDYRNHGSGDFVLPWTYLHGLKDYSDMASHLERHPLIHAVVNFVPVLLEQLEDYAAQFESGCFRDPLLRLLAAPDMSAIGDEDRRLLLDTCLRSDHATMMAPHPHYRHLHDLHLLVSARNGSGENYLSGQYFADLITWYHLSWLGESVRRLHPLPAELTARGKGYEFGHRQRLIALIGEVLRSLIPRYRALADSGQIELSTTPGTHPLSPLMLDFRCALDARPDTLLPCAVAYPGGRSRVAAHMHHAMATHERLFGRRPTGIWPAEGAVSTAFVQQLAFSGCRWAAAGEGVLRNSPGGHAADSDHAACRAWTLDGASGLTLFFRADRLSDLIGFEYSSWNSRDAAGHFVQQLEAILEAGSADERPLVSVILDGENAWEHYPDNACGFFEDLYSLLESNPVIRTTTYAALLDRQPPIGRATLPRLCAGSWVHGSLDTWIGDPDKNRAWDLLCEAKQSYDRVLASGRLAPDDAALAERQLAACESADWFWWLGGGNPSPAATDFDALFRSNLRRLYRLLKRPAPAELTRPITRRRHRPATAPTTPQRTSPAPDASAAPRMRR